MAPPVRTKHPARLAALAAGEKTFDTGQPCSHGHTSLRSTATGKCIECNDIRNARRATGNKPGRPKAARIKPIPQPHRVIQYRPRSPSITPLRGALADYRNSAEARERSDHLDNLLKTFVAPAIKKVPRHDEVE
jgi:hypothetical protein